MTPPARPSVKVSKSFYFRGALREWSNRYFLGGITPADSTKWTALCDAIVTAEKAIYPSSQTIVRCTGYEAGSDVPVFTKAYSTAGTFALGTKWLQQGEVTVLVRYSTASKTVKNHPKYLFNYYHGVVSAGSGAPDTIDTALKTAYSTYAAAWVTGFSDGVNPHPRMGPNGDLALGYIVEDNLTHRDFPRD